MVKKAVFYSPTSQGWGFASHPSQQEQGVPCSPGNGITILHSTGDNLRYFPCVTSMPPAIAIFHTSCPNTGGLTWGPGAGPTRLFQDTWRRPPSRPGTCSRHGPPALGPVAGPANPSLDKWRTPPTGPRTRGVNRPSVPGPAAAQPARPRTCSGQCPPVPGPTAGWVNCHGTRGGHHPPVPGTAAGLGPPSQDTWRAPARCPGTRGGHRPPVHGPTVGPARLSWDTWQTPHAHPGNRSGRLPARPGTSGEPLPAHHRTRGGSSPPVPGCMVDACPPIPGPAAVSATCPGRVGRAHRGSRDRQAVSAVDPETGKWCLPCVHRRAESSTRPGTGGQGTPRVSGRPADTSSHSRDPKRTQPSRPGNRGGRLPSHPGIRGGHNPPVPGHVMDTALLSGDTWRIPYACPGMRGKHRPPILPVLGHVAGNAPPVPGHVADTGHLSLELQRAQPVHPRIRGGHCPFERVGPLLQGLLLQNLRSDLDFMNAFFPYASLLCLFLAVQLHHHQSEEKSRQRIGSHSKLDDYSSGFRATSGQNHPNNSCCQGQESVRAKARRKPPTSAADRSSSDSSFKSGREVNSHCHSSRNSQSLKAENEVGILCPFLAVEKL
ncbi:basic proline-rich protein-like [Macrobrachium nipponense]|uniref:basic proline-rich protein-like n=1 Tax=Macrobrachium nipponense TaxID=159736 RepID=UPI0030C8D261